MANNLIVNINHYQR